MRAMLFTTINDNPGHRNLSSQSIRKDAACPHYLEDTCAVWLRYSKKYVFTGTVVSSARNNNAGPSIVRLMGKRRIERPHCMWLVIWSTWKSMMSKLSKSYPSWLKNPLAKEKKWDGEEEWRRRNVEQEINYMRARVLAHVGCASFNWQHARQEKCVWIYLRNIATIDVQKKRS
jgi:hypothetical protein